MLGVVLVLVRLPNTRSRSDECVIKHLRVGEENVNDPTTVEVMAERDLIIEATVL